MEEIIEKIKTDYQEGGYRRALIDMGEFMLTMPDSNEKAQILTALVEKFPA